MVCYGVFPSCRTDEIRNNTPGEPINQAFKALFSLLALVGRRALWQSKKERCFSLCGAPMKYSLFLALFLSAGLCFSGLAYADETSPEENLSTENPAQNNPVVERFTQDAHETIDIGVTNIMKEMTSPQQLEEAVNLFVETWQEWKHSKLFILKDDRDIDVYGNLYSLQVMCRTLLLAATDWNRLSPGKNSENLLEKALWLDEQSRLLASPVAEILTRQSYSETLKLRVQIMIHEFPYVKTLYNQAPFLGGAG